MELQLKYLCSPRMIKHEAKDACCCCEWIIALLTSCYLDSVYDECRAEEIAGQLWKKAWWCVMASPGRR